ncbi:Conserved_hypothetical protein [Hexamita inflata]|uniref:Uncharacterized protein n=1 Tax=Hexamita inflata TaxID=28002 RepID=A0AA86PWI4_9EUKA|nr:Conserved hypothetical protein [Hexamita inflata]
MWKQNFGQNLMQYFSLFHQLEAATEAEVFEFVVNSHTKPGMWTEVGRICQESQKKVHDFFHNTWSKQFYDSYEPDLNDLYTQTTKLVGTQKPKVVVINQIVQKFVKANKDKRFHIISLRQKLNHHYDRQKGACEPLVVKNTNQTYSDAVDIAGQLSDLMKDK